MMAILLLYQSWIYQCPGPPSLLLLSPCLSSKCLTISSFRALHSLRRHGVFCKNSWQGAATFSFLFLSYQSRKPWEAPFIFCQEYFCKASIILFWVGGCFEKAFFVPAQHNKLTRTPWKALTKVAFWILFYFLCSAPPLAHPNAAPYCSFLLYQAVYIKCLHSTPFITISLLKSCRRCYAFVNPCWVWLWCFLIAMASLAHLVAETSLPHPSKRNF